MPRFTFTTPIGRCAIKWHDAGVTGFELPEAATRASDESAPPPEIAAVAARVQRHLAGEPQDFSDVRFDFSGVAVFDLAVLRATLAIHSGQTRATARSPPRSASRPAPVVPLAPHWARTAGRF